MADYNSGNFLNPDYATPEQVAQMRLYAEQLLKPKGPSEIAPNWAGALAAGLQGAFGGAAMSKANALQRQLLQQQANAIQGAGMNNPAAGVVTGQNPMQPQASALPASGGNNALKAAILMQESGNRDNVGTSSAGAMGPGQIRPATFAAVAKPGENINNPLDNRNVSGRLMDGYMQKYGDPARAAVAYFSGPGNVAPPGSPTPWISDRKDTNGKSVSSYVGDVIGRVGGGGQPQMAQNNALSTLYTTPGVDPAFKQRIMDLNTPTPAEDVTGRPGFRPGVMGAPQLTGSGPGFTPGYRAPATIGPDGGISTTIANPAPGSGGAAGQREQLGNLFQTGQEFAQGATAGAATRSAIADDLKFTQAAFPIMQNLDLMIDDVKRHGDNMTFGPSAELATNVKKVVAQYMPSFMSDKEITGLASQDSLRKQTAMLATAVGRSAGNTDLSLLQGRESVPGEHNSKEGLLALADMIKQQVGLAVRFQMENYDNYGKPGFNQLRAKAEFYKNNPIINPITKNPISVDLAQGEKSSQSQKDFKKLSDEELKKRLGL